MTSTSARIGIDVGGTFTDATLIDGASGRLFSAKAFTTPHDRSQGVIDAIHAVLAESGNDDYRFVRRLLGYGLGVATSYERLKHNAHWLSDTVAGAALGISSAHFAMGRRYASDGESHLALVPIAGGAMLTYRVTMP